MNTTEEVEFDYETYTRENAPDPSKFNGALKQLKNAAKPSKRA